MYLQNHKQFWYWAYFFTNVDAIEDCHQYYKANSSFALFSTPLLENENQFNLLKTAISSFDNYEHKISQLKDVVVIIGNNDFLQRLLEMNVTPYLRNAKLSEIQHLYRKVLVNHIQVDQCEDAKVYYADHIDFDDVIVKIHHDEQPQALRFQNFKLAK